MRARSALLAIALTGAAPASAQECQLCATPPQAEAQANKPLHIDIETSLDFSTAAHTQVGSGSVRIDPRTGARSFAGLIGIGGPALRGTVTITGQPLARIQVQMPSTIRLNSSLGAKADVTAIETTLGPDPLIGLDGRLVFSFGGKLTVIDEAAGDFHGRVQISVDYR